jgi:hypothetical protein
MAELRYRAYISYSHKDEVWAAWLHHAHEPYRVPRHLVGSKTWWQLHAEDFFDRLVIAPELAETGSNDFRSCMEADTAARIYVIDGDFANASSEIAYLESRGYADPGFIQFCEDNRLCGR